MIPVLIVATLNHGVSEMLASIDHPVERVIVIDNGDVEGVVATSQLRIIAPGHNIGVGASWNLGMKVTPTAPWWFICNDDLTWGPGDLARLDAAVDPRSGCLYYTLGMAGFALTRHTLNAVGWFDENIHPAYNEDLDYQRRARLLGIPEVEVGFSGTHEGSATIMADPVLRAVNGRTHPANDAYYAAKWGGPKQGGETFSTPFDRGGHLGEWRLDPERLRNQAWPRR
jgi:hypothetical protein